MSLKTLGVVEEFGMGLSTMNSTVCYSLSKVFLCRVSPVLLLLEQNWIMISKVQGRLLCVAIYKPEVMPSARTGGNCFPSIFIPPFLLH